jgi:hypothetical protein
MTKLWLIAKVWKVPRKNWHTNSNVYLVEEKQIMTYDPIFELETDEDDEVPYEIIILNWLHELESLTPEELQRKLTTEE